MTNIGEIAFGDCYGLTSIISLNKTPPIFENNTSSFDHFDCVNKTNCVVWVPKGCLDAYKEVDVWKEFQNFKELIPGDVNLDSKVNQKDMDTLVDYVMGKDPEGFYEGLGDLNGDDNVNAADIVTLINIR